MADGIKKAAELIAKFERTVVLTGAGISTGSGLPDFRSGTSGLWETYDPDEVASLTAFRHDPYKFYDWLHTCIQGYPQSQPNQAHIALAAMEEKKLVETVITQNVDGLHQASGSKNVIEIHGSIRSFTCASCYTRYNHQSAFFEHFSQQKTLPFCPECHQILKPDVILFGEQIPRKAWRSAEKASASARIFIVIGSSLEVMPVATLPARAINNGAKLIILNKESTYIDCRADVVIHDNVESSLPMILGELGL